MAQNEIQKYYANENLYDAIRQTLNTFYENHNRLERLSSFLNTAEETDYPDIPSGTLSDLDSLRTQVNTYIGNQTTVDLINQIKDFIRI